MSANFCGKCGGAVQNGICTNCGVQVEAQPVYNPAAQKGVFVSPDEHVVYQMGKGYAQMFLAGGGITSNAAAITNKRVYYKGKTLGMVGHCKVTQVIDLKDISSVGIYRIFNIVHVIIAAFIVLLALVMGLAVGSHDDDILVVIGFVMAGCMIGGLLVLIAFLTAKRALRIEYAGGCLAVDMKCFSKAECENFRIALFRAKDEITSCRA